MGGKQKLLIAAIGIFVAIELLIVFSRSIRSSGPDLEIVSPEFPKPVFISTPYRVRRPHLEKSGKPKLNFEAAEGSSVISLEAAVSSSTPMPIIGDLEMITDGVKGCWEGEYVELDPDKQWVQIDLGSSAEIWAIIVWRRFYIAYDDVVVQISNDPHFASGVTTVFNNDHDGSSGLGIGKDPAYVESNYGRIVETSGISGQYVRIYSNGSTEGNRNHLSEVEVWGKLTHTFIDQIRSRFRDLLAHW